MSSQPKVYKQISHLVDYTVQCSFSSFFNFGAFSWESLQHFFSDQQVFYWIGWKPDPMKQPKPLEPHRDSDVSFKDIDNLDSVLHKFDPNKIDNDRGEK